MEANSKSQVRLRESIEEIRAIPALWKHLADPIGELKRIRYDHDYSPWVDPRWAVPFVRCCAKCKCELREPALAALTAIRDE